MDVARALACQRADFYFQQRSIWLQRIVNATKRDKGFNYDKSFIDRILASRVMHPHKLVNHGELSKQTECQPDMDRQ
jgi:ribosomal protein L20